MEMNHSWIENIDPLLRQNPIPEANFNWQQQRQPLLQRFVNEPERSLFTTGPLLSLPNPGRPQNVSRLNRPAEAVPSLPQATRARMISPSPSQEHSQSQCSSARSPAAESDWFTENYYLQDDFSLPNNASYLTQGIPDLWTDPSQSSAIPQLQGNSYVNLNQVQGFADLQEVAFDFIEADEGYMEMELKKEYTIEVDHQVMRSQAVTHQTSYRHSSDEGLGASIKDHNSPRETITIHNHADIDATSEVDVDADADAEDEIITVEPASDTEYVPKSTRTRKRRPSKSCSSPDLKRVKSGRVNKAPSKSSSKNSWACKQCDHASFKDAASLQRHVNGAHTRAFICVFHFAGCNSTFASKNEWKRHVSSQHLNLNAWICELGACGKVQAQSPSMKNGSAPGFTKGSEFNRKDLFTQHLRRMHAPFDVKRKNKKNQEWEDRLKKLQASCVRAKRSPPTQLGCPVQGCDGHFEGANCWDERMEHVGKHLEKAATVTPGSAGEMVKQDEDRYLVSWALNERIIEPTLGGEYKLSGAWFGKTDDEDAEGEFE